MNPPSLLLARSGAKSSYEAPQAPFQLFVSRNATIAHVRVQGLLGSVDSSLIFRDLTKVPQLIVVIAVKQSVYCNQRREKLLAKLAPVPEVRLYKPRY